MNRKNKSIEFAVNLRAFQVMVNMLWVAVVLAFNLSSSVNIIRLEKP
jgi:hypothetical protein